MSLEHNLKYQMDDLLKEANLPENLQAAFQLLQKQEAGLLDNCYQQLQQMKISSQADWTKHWQIMTLLIPQKEESVWHKQRFYPVLPEYSGIYQQKWYSLDDDKSLQQDEIQPRTEFYWHGSLPELQRFLSQNSLLYGTWRGKDGTVQEFSYRMVPSQQAIEQEELLYRLADIYAIKRPILFSPWSRRLLSIRIEQPMCTEEEFFAQDNGQMRYDFCWQRNGLDGKILEGKELIWNVRRLPDADFNASVTVEEEPTTVGQEMQYLLEFNASAGTDEDFYPRLYLTLPRTKSNNLLDVQVKIKNAHSLHLSVHTDVPLTTPCKTEGICIEPLSMDVRQALADKPIAFSNDYEMPMLSTLDRLLSKGEIIRQLARYETAHFACTEPSLRKPDNVEVIMYHPQNIYREDMLYHKRRQMQLPACYILFYAKEMQWQNYLVDYAQYVLADLKRRYPDYRWLGVKA